MASALITSFLGGLQASVSVLLTLSYGLIAARLGMVHETTAHDISSLCRNLFLPALLITDIGSQLNVDKALDYYAPIFIWSITYALTSITIGKIAVKVFGLPSWTVVAITFNNTTSLPLLLTKSLLETGILTGIAGGDVEAAVGRATSYFLINSFVSKVLTFSVGPMLLGPGGDVSGDAQQRVRDGDGDGEDDGGEEGQYSDNERTSLLPKPVSTPVTTIREMAITKFQAIPHSIRKPLLHMGALFNPTTWGGIIAAIVGLVPGLHRAAFAPSDQGGIFNAWFTSSLRNLGGLFSGMEMFVVGSRLSDSFDVPPHTPSPQPPKSAVIVIIAARFFILGAIGILVIYVFAAKTKLLGDDPVLWWSMMLMPIGPPGMIVSVLLEVTNAETRAKMMVARMLAYNYLVTPLVALAIVCALRATEAAQKMHEYQ